MHCLCALCPHQGSYPPLFLCLIHIHLTPTGIIEERGIETLFKGQHQLCHVLSFAVRTANTFVGSLLWVDFVRLMGMQSAKPKAVEALDAPAVSEAPVAAAAGHKGKGKKDK